jgi:phospholipid/cholesterol/gamma-HCH transport system ATP-binding protein
MAYIHLHLGNHVATLDVCDYALKLIAGVDCLDCHVCLHWDFNWNGCQSTNGKAIAERRKTGKLMKKSGNPRRLNLESGCRWGSMDPLSPDTASAGVSMPASTNWIEIRNLTFRRSPTRWIFKDVNMNIERNKVTAIMGPSGCGKTTLLKLISGQLQPETGSIRVDGLEVNQLDRQGLLALRRRMGMLFQSGALFTDLSVYENVAFPLRVHTRLPEEVIRDLVLMKLQAVGLRGARDLMPSELSGGMARRVALARTIILDPELIMYDEPFAGQDPILAGVLRDLIQRINQGIGATSIIVSHDVAETASIADYIFVLADGRIIGQGPPDEVMNSRDPMVRQFLQGLPDGPVPFHFPSSPWPADLRRERRG